MLRFVDGPAADEALVCRRAPRLLRVTKSPSGKWDALDQLDDEPTPRETLYAYERISEPRGYHLKATTKKQSGFFVSANYRLYQIQPSDEVMRSTEAWRAWCQDIAKGVRIQDAEPDNEAGA